ncbi:Uncharacterised protein [uncultured archaeon]|nr:Uncharacterised protein [uncultured archaeon]
MLPRLFGITFIVLLISPEAKPSTVSEAAVKVVKSLGTGTDKTFPFKVPIEGRTEPGV